MKRKSIPKEKRMPFLCTYCEENDKFVVDAYGCVYCKNCRRLLGNDNRVEKPI